MSPAMVELLRRWGAAAAELDEVEAAVVLTRIAALPGGIEEFVHATFTGFKVMAANNLGAMDVLAAARRELEKEPH